MRIYDPTDVDHWTEIEKRTSPDAYHHHEHRIKSFILDVASAAESAASEGPRLRYDNVQAELPALWIPVGAIGRNARRIFAAKLDMGSEEELILHHIAGPLT